MRLRPLNRGLALLAVTGLTLASAQVAGAQSPPPGGNQPPPGQQPPTGNQPPSGQQPPTAAQGADVGITLSGSGGGSRVEEGETYRWEAVVRNHGPGVARDVKIIVSTPHAFDLDKVNHDGECETNPGGEGRMVCSFGDLAAGAQIELKFSGQFRDNKRFRTHVFVESTTTDPDPTNNNDKQRFKVHQNENENERAVGNALACGSGPVTLADADGDAIDVNADLEVRVNGETVFQDDDQFSNSAPFTPIDPIEFQAEDGDTLRVIARTGVTPVQSLDALTLFCDDGRSQELTSGVPGAFAMAGNEFFNANFVIRLGGAQGQ